MANLFNENTGELVGEITPSQIIKSYRKKDGWCVITKSYFDTLLEKQTRGFYDKGQGRTRNAKLDGWYLISYNKGYDDAEMYMLGRTATT
jgi:hypothetical protein